LSLLVAIVFWSFPAPFMSPTGALESTVITRGLPTPDNLEPARRDLRAEAITPFLLRRLRALEGDRIVVATRALPRRDARVAAAVA
jgi:pseudouridine-5'-phosphate glycosidase